MTKRKDNKGRILKQGESQRKDGRYMYKYIDEGGEVRYLYSWKLTERDKLPKGKKNTQALRTQISELAHIQLSGYNSLEKRVLLYLDEQQDVKKRERLTFEKAIEVFFTFKRNIRHHTYMDYSNVLNRIMKVGKLHKVYVDEITPTQIYQVFMKTYGKLSKRSIMGRRAVLKTFFNELIKYDYLDKNPIKFASKDISDEPINYREPLSEDIEHIYLEYVRENWKQNYNLIKTMLNTGLRLGEVAAIQKKDIDFKNKFINVDKQLTHIENRVEESKPKTQKAYRKIPMLEEVEDCIKDELDKPYRKSNYIFLNRKGQRTSPRAIMQRLERVNKGFKQMYPNIEYKPRITAHIFRHTFCSKMIRYGMNPKTLQVIMGHNSIETTLNIYTHLSPMDTYAEMINIVKNKTTKK